jgi:hypothetical protein
MSNLNSSFKFDTIDDFRIWKRKRRRGRRGVNESGGRVEDLWGVSTVFELIMKQKNNKMLEFR